MLKIDAARLVAAVVQSGTGKVELCVKAGVGHQTLAKLAHGEMMRYPSMVKICSVLDLAPAEIIEEADENLQSANGALFWYLRRADTLISLKAPRKGHALRLLQEYQAKRLGIYRVPHKRASEIFEPDAGGNIKDRQKLLGHSF